MLLDIKDICLSVVSIILVAGFVMLVKHFLNGYRRPNGKKGGIISNHVAIAFAVVTVVALTTQDLFITLLVVLLAYIIGRGRLDEGQHYVYQVVIGAIIGVAIPYGVFYLYNNKFGSGGYITNTARMEYDDIPDRAHDDRHEADENAPELKIDDDLEL